MKSSRLLGLVVLSLLLAGCGLSSQEKVDYARVESSGVSPAIYDKMVHGDPLGISDVEALSRARVSSGIILRYMRDQGSIYFLSAKDVSGLEKAGVDPSVIDYMLQTAQNEWEAGPYPYDYPFDTPFWWDPGLYGGFYYGGIRGSFYGRHGGYHGGHGGYHGGGHGGHH